MVYTKLLTKKMHFGGDFCDFAKASDCSNHKILLATLQGCW